MKNILKEYFDGIYVISLDHRSDRRDSFGKELSNLGLAEPEEITWFRAVSGEKCWAPGFFAAGAGAWGCLQSHMRILEGAIMDGKEQILVLEDDATFHPKAAKMLELLFKQVPADWDQIFLGGEHAASPERIKHRPFVLKAKCVHRTHAIAMKRNILPAVYQHIANYPDYMNGGQWHVDHQLGEAHRCELWKTYAPSWWIAGQKAGSSDISERKNPDYWWHPDTYAPELPFIWISCIQDLKGIAAEELIHFGNNLVRDSLQDEGLEKCVTSDANLLEWLQLIAKEAISMGKVPGIYHPEISFDRVASIWSGDAMKSQQINFDELTMFPFFGKFRFPQEIGKLFRELLIPEK